MHVVKLEPTTFYFSWDENHLLLHRGRYILPVPSYVLPVPDPLIFYESAKYLVDTWYITTSLDDGGLPPLGRHFLLNVSESATMPAPRFDQRSPPPPHGIPHFSMNSRCALN